MKEKDTEEKTVRRFSNFANKNAKQKFSEQERKGLSKYSSVSYAPTHSELYQAWLRENSIKDRGFCARWDRWLLLTIIGVCIGLVATLLQECIQALSKVRWDRTIQYIQEGDLARAWGWNTGIGIVYVVISSFCICFVHPPAAGGGTPEVISFLNGIVVHGSLSLKNLVVKFIANVFAVSSGLPAAIQGPIINFGAIIGAGMGQFESKALGWSPKAFKRFRNAEDRRAFTTAGVAAGVAAAFNAPIGGLLFAMEDLSSFWSKHLSWQTFFCCVVATGVASMFNTAFTGFQFSGLFGLFSLSLAEPIQIHVAILVPAIVLGLIGGIMGAFFTQLNRGFVMARKIIIGSIKSQLGQKIVKILETIMLVCIIHTYTTILPRAFECSEMSFNSSSRLFSECYFTTLNRTDDIKYQKYECTPSGGNTSSIDYYNQVATLSMQGGTGYLKALWSRSTLYAFDYPALLSVLAIWVVMTAWTAGSAIAGGIFVPTLVTGSLYGRAVGVAMIYVWQSVTGTEFPVSDEWHWIDPGVMSVIGAASMLSGVTRLAIAATVIVVEMSHDTDLVIPVLIAILVAKFVADFLSKPLYKIQLDGKLLPYLDQDPQVVVNDSIANLELYKVCDVMKEEVCTIHSTETVAALAKLLVETDHGAFPVVRYDEETRTELALGLITRNELYVILCSQNVYDENKAGTIIRPNIPYRDISVDYITDASAALERVKSYTKFPVHHSLFISLDPFISLSAPKIDQDYSLYRAYVIFRTLGLRHLVVTDIRNRVVGIVTRKDLMAFNISEKLALRNQAAQQEGSQIDSGCDMPSSVTITTYDNHVSMETLDSPEGAEEGNDAGYHTSSPQGCDPSLTPSPSQTLSPVSSRDSLTSMERASPGEPCREGTGETGGPGWSEGARPSFLDGVRQSIISLEGRRPSRVLHAPRERTDTRLSIVSFEEGRPSIVSFDGARPSVISIEAPRGSIASLGPRGSLAYLGEGRSRGSLASRDSLASLGDVGPREPSIVQQLSVQAFSSTANQHRGASPVNADTHL